MVRQWILIDVMIGKLVLIKSVKALFLTDVIFDHDFGVKNGFDIYRQCSNCCKMDAF